MKAKRSFVTLVALFGVLGVLGSCSGGESSMTSSEAGSQTGSSTSIAGGTVSGEKKTLVAAYTSPAELTYRNMRPTYNYYMTYFNFETIELFDDNTYAFTYASSMFSGVILPDEGNDAAGNERTNTIEIYYGNYTSKTNDLDEDSVDITLSVPNRLVVSYDSTYFVDTAQWTDAMADAVAVKDGEGNVTTSYTAESYLASKAFHEKTVMASKVNYSFDFFALREDGEEDPDVTLSTQTDGLVAAYLSPASLSYMNMRPAYNYYITSFAQQQLLVYEDGTYSMNIYSSQFSGLVLPEEGNDIVGNERINYTQKFTGEYTSKTNDLDEDSLDISLAKPDRALLYFDSTYYLDSENWTDEMTEKTSTTDENGATNSPYENGEDYLAAVAFEAREVLASKVNYSFDYISDLVDPILV